LNDDKLISVSRDGTVNIWNFNYSSKQVLEKRCGKDIPFFLIDLGIIDKKECSNKLNCTPDDLSEIGICSSADLKALGLFKNSFHFDYLKVIAEEDIQEHDQLRKIK